jgi:hypothetical protein
MSGNPKLGLDRCVTALLYGILQNSLHAYPRGLHLFTLIG